MNVCGVRGERDTKCVCDIFFLFLSLSLVFSCRCEFATLIESHLQWLDISVWFIESYRYGYTFSPWSHLAAVWIKMMIIELYAVQSRIWSMSVWLIHIFVYAWKIEYLINKEHWTKRQRATRISNIYYIFISHRKAHIKFKSIFS